MIRSELSKSMAGTNVPYTKRQYESDADYEERLNRVRKQNKTFENLGISQEQRKEAIASQGAKIKSDREVALEREKAFHDYLKKNNIKSTKEQRLEWLEKERNSPFGKILKGIVGAVELGLKFGEKVGIPPKALEIAGKLTEGVRETVKKDYN